MQKFLEWLRTSFAVWVRANLVLMIFAAMLLLQFLTWRSIVHLEQIRPGEPPSCTLNNPCTVDLTGGAVEAIGRALMKYR
jgi:hypothetical protein